MRGQCSNDQGKQQMSTPLRLPPPARALQMGAFLRVYSFHRVEVSTYFFRSSNHVDLFVFFLTLQRLGRPEKRRVMKQSRGAPNI